MIHINNGHNKILERRQTQWNLVCKENLVISLVSNVSDIRGRLGKGVDCVSESYSVSRPSQPASWSIIECNRFQGPEYFNSSISFQDSCSASKQSFQNWMLDFPPGGAWTLTEVPETLFPKTSKASATPYMFCCCGTAAACCCRPSLAWC